MKLQTPIPDLYLTGLDDRANTLAIFKRTGLGQVPQHVGDIGWFGAEYIRTMMVDCGCGKGRECDHPSILYVELLPDNGYAFFYDESGEFVTCEAQSNVISAKRAGFDDVFAYLDSIQDQYRSLTADFEAHVQPCIDTLRAAKTQTDLMELQLTITSLPSMGSQYVMGRMSAAANAYFEYSRRRLILDAMEYVYRINKGEKAAKVIADMKAANVDPEVIELLETYSQAQTKRMGDASDWSSHKSTGTIH